MDGEKTVGQCAIKMLFTINVPHVLEKIFFSLDYDSFQSCLRVNNTWKEMLLSEAFQKKYHKLMIEKEKNGQNLWRASREGNKEEVKRLIFHAGWIDVNYFELSDQSTPLYQAAQYGHKCVVQLLLDNGAESNKGTERETPLHAAAYWGYTDVVQLLLDGEADPDLAGNSMCLYSLVNPATRMTALHMAAFRGHKEVVQVLLDGGANPNLQTGNGWTPLRFARAKRSAGCKDVAKLLEARGAKVYGKDPLTWLFKILARWF